MSSHKEMSLSRDNILNLADSFVDEMVKMTNILKVMSISSLLMLAIAVGLTVYLVYHPLFMNLLATNNDVRFTLSILTASILAIFSVCTITSIRQYKFINSWNKRYQSFILKKDELDKKLTADLNPEQRD
jgi:amino acid permease